MPLDVEPSQVVAAREDRAGGEGSTSFRTASAIGWRGRQPRVGPENELVERFLHGIRFRATAGTRLTIFREPKLQSGFPDIVAVRWDEDRAARWGAERASLHEDELRLLHFLTLTGTSCENSLRRHHFDGVDASLQRLADVGLVRRARSGWRASPLRSTFAVRSIVAFEAKISSWRSAIEQAFLNRWFASESYVLVPSNATLKRLVDAARDVGVGVWVEGEQAPVLRAVKCVDRQPVSYASWLFNDWCWRYALAERTRCGG